MSTAEVVASVVTRSAAETEALAARFAGALRAGDRVALEGDLGGGKTTFVRGVARGLGSPHADETASPTFALHHRYPGGRLDVDHLDLYRLKAPVDLRREGLAPVAEDFASVVLCEWPERLGAPLPGLAYVVRFEMLGEDERRVVVAARDAEAAGRMREALR
ncbi:MAG TPA: tRNA (adenosine(37)-N6)-threonylcarbamoyltransferase complex ATPase subunit type 1 TsaE [Planctomycetota bacterium]|nr:tRNA (adenosine(37)-N6)-threonylcarbamoyltransferase complex ATPase subunit type 1 TsaE [Planctomycetota bacterium]